MPSSRWLPNAWRTSFHFSIGIEVQSAGVSAGGAFNALQLDHRRDFDPGAEDRPEGDEVGVGAAVRLGVGVVGSEQLAGAGVGQVLDRVDVVAAGVEPTVRDALGVLVGQQVAHGALRGERRIVLAGDQLDVARAGRPVPGRSPGRLRAKRGPRSLGSPGKRGTPGRRRWSACSPDSSGSERVACRP